MGDLRVKGVVLKSSEDREIGLCKKRRVILIISFEHAGGKLALASRRRVRLRRNGNRHSLENRHRHRRRWAGGPGGGPDSDRALRRKLNVWGDVFVFLVM